MKIRVGYELIYDCPQPTPMMLVLNIHYTRASDLSVPDHVIIEPSIPIAVYRDSFGNWCSRIVAPKGQTRITSTAVVNDSGEPEVVATSAQQHSIQDLPEEALVFLLASRYCDTEKFSQIAWNMFGHTPTGWGRVQAICDSCTSTSHSAMSMRAPQEQPGKLSTSGAASAATSPILPLPCADA